MILAVLKLTIKGHWSWWRVLLPVWVVLGHNAMYVAVGFVWLSFTDDGTMDEESVARPAWFWPSSGRWEMIVAFGVLSIVCQLVF